MPFDYCKITTGSDYYGDAAPYQAQIPVVVEFQISTTYTDIHYLRLTIYWYQWTSSTTMQRMQKQDTITYTTGTRVFRGNFAVMESDGIDIQKIDSSTVPPIKYAWFTAELLTSNSTVRETLQHDFRIYGQPGTVNWTYPVPAIFNTSYPLVGESAYITTMVSDFASTSSGTPLVWREAYGKIAAGNWAKIMVEYGGQLYDLDHSYIRYFIANTWSINSYINYQPNSSTMKLPLLYIASLDLAGGFISAGTFRVCIAYYEKRSSDYGGQYTLSVVKSPSFTVYYPFGGAAFHISSIAPSEYQEGSPDPLNGKPPFTVTIVDDTYRGTYTIPLKSITVDWDDPQSESGVWTRTNPGTSYLTIPPHVYNDGNAHNIQMICTDYRDNVTTERVTFAPSKEPRIIHPPTVTYDSSDAPVLVTGTIDVAGIPLPEITWTYTLRNSESGYYAGEKKGEYTELSLLAGGTYDITCKAMNGEVTLGTWSWVKTITEPAPIPDTPVSANNFDIWVYQNGQRVDVIKPTRCQYVDRLAHSSYCEFELPMNYRNISLLMPGAEIAVGYLGKARYMMVTEFSEDSVGEYCSVTAMDAATVALQNRIATVATHSLSDGGYDVQTCSAERLLRYFAVSNIRSGNRVVPRFKVVGTNQDRGGKVTYSARYEPILTIMEEICTQSGLGWDSSLQSDSSVIFSFKVIGGVDHTAGTTAPVIFTERENGLRSAQVSAYHGMLGSNLVIAAGKGEGDTRVQYQDYGATTVSDIQRREVFLDASDSATDYEVQCAAETELARQDEQTITIYPNEQVYKFGVDYNLGDYVTVITKSGMQLNLQIHQANMSLDDTGVNLSLECGTDIRDYQRLIQRNKFENTYARK